MELALETGSLAVTLLHHFDSLFLSPSIETLMALPTLGMQGAELVSLTAREEALSYCIGHPEPPTQSQPANI